MAIWTIDGTVVKAEATRSRWGQTQYKNVTIRKSDGSEESIDKFGAAGAMQDMISEGRTGRFYLFKAAGHKGFFGYRGEDGEKVYAFPKFLFWGHVVTIVLMLIFIAWKWGDWYDIRVLLGIACLIGATIYLILDRLARRSTENFFERDTSA